MKSTYSFDQQLICYKIHKNNSKETVVLIPGFAMDHTLWDEFYTLLAKDYNIILIDHRGTGMNLNIPFCADLESLAKDVIAVLNAEKIHSIRLVGHSMGGYLAQHLAFHYPSYIHSLILINSYSQSLSNQLWSYQSLAELIQCGVDRKILIKNSLPWLYGAQYLADKQNGLNHITKMSERKFQPPLETIFAQMELIAHYDESHLSPQISTKTLIIGGSEDRIIPEAYFIKLAKVMPNATLAILDNVGHMSYIEAPQTVVNYIREFNI